MLRLLSEAPKPLKVQSSEAFWCPLLVPCDETQPAPACNYHAPRRKCESIRLTPDRFARHTKTNKKDIRLGPSTRLQDLCPVRMVTMCRERDEARRRYGEFPSSSFGDAGSAAYEGDAW